MDKLKGKMEESDYSDPEADPKSSYYDSDNLEPIDEDEHMKLMKIIHQATFQVNQIQIQTYLKTHSLVPGKNLLKTSL